MNDLPNHRHTSRAMLWSNLLSEPLFTLYGFLVFFMYKDLGASALQIALLTMLKPVITILSFYWSAGLKGKSKKLKTNVLWAGFLMRAPFLLCPFFSSPWFLLLAAVNYMFFYRAGIPAWMEIIKRNVGEKNRGKIFSISSALGYGEGVILALGFGAVLDHDPSLWKMLFLVSASIGLLSLLFQARIEVSGKEAVEEEDHQTLWQGIVRPWKDSYQLMRARPDFSRYQWGFMICGFGIMLIQPALPLFAVDVLGVSYLEMAAAISIAKGLGFVISSPLWAQGLARMNVLKLASFVFFLISLFPIILSCAVWNIAWLYIAYFFYGIGQGGSHLVWNMSGPIFAGKEDSARYSGVNVVLAGIRGAVAPPLGGFFAAVLGPVQVLIAGSALCLYSGVRLFQSRFAKDPLSIKS